MYPDGGLQFPFLPSLASPAPAENHYCYSMNFPLSYEYSDASFQQDCGVYPMDMFEANYDLWEEWDLFKAPQSIAEEPIIELDPVTLAAAMSFTSCGYDVLTESNRVADIEPDQREHHDDVFHECKDLLEMSMIQEAFPELLDVKIPATQTGAVQSSQPNNEDTMQKSASSGSLNSRDWIYPNFLGFQGLDFEAFGMRRSFSEGDILNLCNKNTSVAHPNTARSPAEQSLAINDPKTEERRQKLSRYWKKKGQRNFGRKIKYACRKALADSQPRVRGRFAKNEHSEASITKQADEGF